MFTAQYHDECAACGEDVKGTQCRYTTQDRIEHVECPPVISALVMCPNCFIELPVTGICSECENKP